MVPKARALTIMAMLIAAWKPEDVDRSGSYKALHFIALWSVGALPTYATERSYTDTWMVRVAGAMDQRRLLSLSTTGPAKRVSPH